MRGPYRRPGEADLRRGAAASYGRRPAPAGPRPRMRLLKWRPLAKDSLLGFADILLPNGLKIFEIPVLSSEGRVWAGMPGKPQVDKDGNTKRDGRGKITYAPVIQWRSKELGDAFSARLAELIRSAHPGALDDRGAP